LSQTQTEEIQSTQSAQQSIQFSSKTESHKSNWLKHAINRFSLSKLYSYQEI